MILCCNTQMTQGKLVIIGFHSSHLNDNKEEVHAWYTRLGSEYQCGKCGTTIVHIKTLAKYCDEQPKCDLVVEE